MASRPIGNWHPRRQAGTTALEVAIFMIAGLVVATVATVTLLNVSFGVANAGESVAGDGVQRTVSALELRPGVIAIRGDVDVDGDDSIDLGGPDQRAVVMLEFTLTVATGQSIDMTPPYSSDDTGIDPDLAPTNSTTIIGVSTDSWQVSESAWGVTIVGGDSDNILESGERAIVNVWLNPVDTGNALYDLGSGKSDPWIDTAQDLVTSGERISVRVSVQSGMGVEFERILPIDLTQRILLD